MATWKNFTFTWPLWVRGGPDRFFTVFFDAFPNKVSWSRKIFKNNWILFIEKVFQTVYSDICYRPYWVEIWDVVESCTRGYLSFLWSTWFWLRAAMIVYSWCKVYRKAYLWLKFNLTTWLVWLCGKAGELLHLCAVMYCQGMVAGRLRRSCTKEFWIYLDVLGWTLLYLDVLPGAG